MIDHQHKPLTVLVECALPVVFLLVLVVQVENGLAPFGRSLDHRCDVFLVDAPILLGSGCLDALVGLERVGKSCICGGQSIKSEAVTRSASSRHPLSTPLVRHREDERHRHLALLGLLLRLLEKVIIVTLFSTLRIDQVL